ncbi:histone-lysine N-methyltransferase SETMAR [Plakobranchus ocellatus]|uniref:Histone-lysine N-methyltransferase SETMAR n=1 Tax=Plakobranchus ocellatus TaxID=259542 RepID=A0AAV4CAC6_9GAST|nr:histone-lysine N-methyltransferase SETMAR [Plakobranchus ocellatus]
MKAQRKDMCTQLLERYNAEGEAFLQHTQTRDKSWVHHYIQNKYLKGYHYDNDEEFIADVRRWCRGQLSKFFADGMRQLVKRWRLCVDRDRDYVEK